MQGSTFALALGLSFVLAACGKSADTPPAAPAQPSSGYGQPYGQSNSSGAAPYGQPASSSAAFAQPASYGYGQAPAQPASASGQIAPLGALFADPATLQSILAGALAGGAAALGALSGGLQAPIEQGIETQASSQAKGMRPEGQLLSATLAPDGHAEGSLTLQPGSCYAVIGFGAPGAVDYQISVTTTAPMPPQILAQSGATGAAPVVGANDQCVRSPFPLPFVVKIDLHLLRGQGMVGAQVYVK
jgi:hypothetical protein